MKIAPALLLSVLAVALTGCGDPAPSTPLAPDIPVSSSDKSTGSADLAKIKEAEHGAPADDRNKGR